MGGEEQGPGERCKGSTHTKVQDWGQMEGIALRLIGKEATRGGSSGDGKLEVKRERWCRTKALRLDFRVRKGRRK